MAVDLILHDDRLDLLTERVDVAFRIGALPDSAMVQRALPPIPLVLCASPEYLARRGRPATPAELADHDCLDFFTTGPSRWRLSTSQGAREQPVSGPVRADSAQALRLFALAGLGIAMAPRPVVRGDLADGTLCEILKDHQPEPLRLSILALPGRLQTPRVQGFVDMVREELTDT